MGVRADPVTHSLGWVRVVGMAWDPHNIKERRRGIMNCSSNTPPNVGVGFGLDVASLDDTFGCDLDIALFLSPLHIDDT